MRHVLSWDILRLFPVFFREKAALGFWCHFVYGFIRRLQYFLLLQLIYFSLLPFGSRLEVFEHVPGSRLVCSSCLFNFIVKYIALLQAEFGPVRISWNQVLSVVDFFVDFGHNTLSFLILVLMDWDASSFSVDYCGLSLLEFESPLLVFLFIFHKFLHNSLFVSLFQQLTCWGVCDLVKRRLLWIGSGIVNQRFPWKTLITWSQVDFTFAVEATHFVRVMFVY